MVVFQHYCHCQTSTDRMQIDGLSITFCFPISSMHTLSLYVLKNSHHCNVETVLTLNQLWWEWYPPKEKKQEENCLLEKENPSKPQLLFLISFSLSLAEYFTSSVWTWLWAWRMCRSQQMQMPSWVHRKELQSRLVSLMGRVDYDPWAPWPLFDPCPLVLSLWICPAQIWTNAAWSHDPVNTAAWTHTAATCATASMATPWCRMAPALVSGLVASMCAWKRFGL